MAKQTARAAENAHTPAASMDLFSIYCVIDAASKSAASMAKADETGADIDGLLWTLSYALEGAAVAALAHANAAAVRS